MRYFAGQALPGTETRAGTLPMGRLGEFLGLVLYPGTFNVVLLETPPLNDLPGWRYDVYQLWPCWVATEPMVREGVSGLTGWIVRVDGETFPEHFIEVISPRHLRKVLKQGNWMTFPVEIALELGNGA